MHTALILLLGAAVVAALPTDDGTNMIGGSVTNIEQYPFAAALLASKTGVAHSQSCSGTIISKQAVLTAAHCFRELPSTLQWRSRVGSSLSYTGGTVFNTDQIIIHPHYNPYFEYNDIAVIRIAGSFSFNDNVQAGVVAGPNYEIADNVPVETIGWGLTVNCKDCPESDQLREVEVYTVNYDTCRQLYSEILEPGVDDTMLCAGWRAEGGRDACQGGSGGPLLHNNVVVGVRAWGDGCAQASLPGVYTRVDWFSNWITSYA